MMCLSTSSRFVFAVGDTAAYSQVQARPPLTYILSYFIKRPDLLGCRVVFKARPNQHHLHDPNNQHPPTYLAHLSPTSSYPPLHNAICQDPATTSVPLRGTTANLSSSLAPCKTNPNACQLLSIFHVCKHRRAETRYTCQSSVIYYHKLLTLIRPDGQILGHRPVVGQAQSCSRTDGAMG